MPANTKEIVNACCQQIRWDELDPEPIRQLIALAVNEDTCGSGLREKPVTTGDPSSALLASDQSVSATLRARESLTLCGMALAPLVLEAFDGQLSLDAFTNDGDPVEAGESIARICGPLQSTLTAERTLLNFLQRLSGIATTTRLYVAALEGSVTRLLDTRKTSPGYRYLEKYAVACGGGWNHRMGLFDRVMLKDNHLASLEGGLTQAAQAAVRQSRERNPHLLVEMEVDRLDQIDAALAAQVDVILLDNFSTEDLEKAITRIGSRAATEISGNVTLDTIPALRKLGTDFISTGALVHKSVWVDIALDWD